MGTPVLICDDSSFARKQMARALPSEWDIDISFAADGEEGLSAIREGKGDILFLDLNMPVKDGYETLETILKEDLPTMTIVVSGDIQPEARERVKALGALEFIKKPVDSHEVTEILKKYGISVLSESTESQHGSDIEVNLRDGYQELANVAMGRAADLLARLLNAFVIMPIPTVSDLAINELKMTLNEVVESDEVSAVCQGFIGAGIAGEALMVFTESSFSDIAELMRYEGDIDDTVELELLMDISSILCSAFLNGIADQLDINFSQGHPVVLGRHIKTADLLRGNAAKWNTTLAIEMCYTIEDRNITCDLMLLFTEDSIEPLNERVSYLLD